MVVTTVRSLVLTTMRRMIVVRDLIQGWWTLLLTRGLTGDHGVSGVVVQGVVSGPGSRGAGYRSAVLGMAGVALLILRRDIASLGNSGIMYYNM